MAWIETMVVGEIKARVLELFRISRFHSKATHFFVAPVGEGEAQSLLPFTEEEQIYTK